MGKGIQTKISAQAYKHWNNNFYNVTDLTMPLWGRGEEGNIEKGNKGNQRDGTVFLLGEVKWILREVMAGGR